jgi:ribosomal protein S18 acetylase RimI-like enzyme
LSADEWSLFRDVRLAALRDAPHAFSTRFADENPRTEAEWRAKVAGWTRFVIELDGRVVATVSGGPSKYPGTAVLTSLWVDPAARGRGIGDRLIQTVVDWSRESANLRLVLWVADGNHHAENLYQRHGFEKTGETIHTPRPEFEMSLNLR